jgi:membrane glycosyltransferase
MSPREIEPAMTNLPLTAASAMTPAGIQKAEVLTRRRWIVFVLNATTYLGLLAWLASILGHSGWSIVDVAIFFCFAIASPWTVLGLWNAIIGVWALHFSGDPLVAVAPHAAAADVPSPITVRTAIVMAIYNEDPRRAILRLEIVRESVERTGQGAHFDYFVLSDTRDSAIAQREEEEFAQWKARVGAGAERLHYRRRANNEGFKAGNMREFVETRGHDYEFMIPLDADSLMSGEAIVRMVRVGQAWPRIGILQGLVVGAPAKSGFARLFQFGMRHAMRPYTSGAAWWNGDCGPFWGHNALVRIAPFRDQCHLPELPGKGPLGGRILSHDQVEAVLMRRAGFEVRVLPQEGGNWEDNPPTLSEFSRRDTRWCQGNLQYLKLLDLKGIEATSRFQLIWAIMMFIGIPAWTAIIAMVAIKPLDGENYANFPAASAIWLYVVFMLMYLAPKLAGYVDVALTKGGLQSYGGGPRFAAGVVAETVFSLLLSPATTFRTAVFVLGLPFGLSATWSGQSRDAHRVAWDEAARLLWPQMLFAIFIFGAAFLLARAAILPSLPLTLGYLVAIPLAVVTSSAALGEFLQRTGLCAIPEEYATPQEIADFEARRSR